MRLVVPSARQGPGAIASQSVERLDLALARRSAGLLPGDRRAPGVGAGTELAQLRPYEPGDDLRQIDAAASARTNVAHVRQHVPERTLTTWLVLDVSASMAFGTGDRLKSDVAEGVAEVIGRLAVRRGGRLALVTAGDPDRRSLPPHGGRGAFARVRRIVRSGVAPDGAEAALDLTRALHRVRRLAPARGLVVVVSDLRDDGWQAPLRALAARHAVVAVEIVDPREAELPDAGDLSFVDPETGQVAEVHTSDPAVRAAYAAAERERRDATGTTLRRAGAEHLVVSTSGDWLRDLARGFR